MAQAMLRLLATPKTTALRPCRESMKILSRKTDKDKGGKSQAASQQNKSAAGGGSRYGLRKGSVAPDIYRHRRVVGGRTVAHLADADGDAVGHWISSHDVQTAAGKRGAERDCIRGDHTGDADGGGILTSGRAERSAYCGGPGEVCFDGGRVFADLGGAVTIHGKDVVRGRAGQSSNEKGAAVRGIRQ